jgi:class 3 adenylate cyclase/putative methionine-R-sulfoxide reductase with GAF domain
MSRRSRAGGKQTKLRRHKAAMPKRDAAPTLRHRSSAVGHESEFRRERDEALEREIATSEVLRLISRSPGDLELVFKSILENATRICEAYFATLYLREGSSFRAVALHNAPPAYVQERKRNPLIHPPATGALTRLIATKQTIHITDLRTDQSYLHRTPGTVALVEAAGARSYLAVPMLKDDDLIGAIVIYRQEVRQFTDKQIALVQNFAAQAVIAIENTRLLNELRESLAQQTATSEVLRVISSSPGELEPVFQAMLENATRICEAQFGILYLSDGDMLRFGADVGTPPKFAEFQRQRGVFRPRPGTRLEHVMLTKEVNHTADLTTTAVPDMSAVLGGARSIIYVPMLRDEQVIGVICIYRQEVRPFTDEQVALVQNFAAQAVIAIENTRLLNELRQRTTDLTESLKQQTATAEVLQVINSSPGDLARVFDAMIEKARALCDAPYGNMMIREGERFRAIAAHAPAAFAEIVRRGFNPHPNSPLGRLKSGERLIHIGDLAEAARLVPDDPIPRAAIELGHVRTVLMVPLIKNDMWLGVFALWRPEVRPFADREIEVVQNFAAQAVIAIENARLLNELRGRTAELEARSQEIASLNQQLEQRVADQVGEIERMGRLRRFLPPQVADLIVASGTEKQLESHRREITALFCDLRGFTGFSESSDPEDVMALLRDYHAAIGEIIVKYSGTLERFAGDGVMVIFNDPVPVENPALQAVLMALDMRTAIGAMIEKWRLLGHDLGFGIGIAHGFATLGTIGFEGRFDYAAIGTVSNVASRLCDEAKPGQILISPRVMLAVDKTITVELVGEFNLKGIRRPMAAYNVLAPSISKPN